MIDYERRPAQYRGTIEVYPNEVPSVWFDAPIEWRWRCRSRNNTILASGEGYRRQRGALNAIDAQYAAKFKVVDGTLTFIGTAYFVEEETQLPVAVVPWRLVIRDRHGDIDKIGAVY